MANVPTIFDDPVLDTFDPFNVFSDFRFPKEAEPATAAFGKHASRMMSTDVRETDKAYVLSIAEGRLPHDFRQEVPRGRGEEGRAPHQKGARFRLLQPHVLCWRRSEAGGLPRRVRGRCSHGYCSEAHEGRAGREADDRD